MAWNHGVIHQGVSMGSRRWIATAAVVFMGGCAGAQQRDWAFVQSIGGMAVGRPYRTAAGVMLPVRVDVSGLEAITTEPTTMNSGLALKEVTVRRQGDILRLGVVTGLASHANQPTAANDLLLGDLAPGLYDVVYDQPDGTQVSIGRIVVAPP